MTRQGSEAEAARGVERVARQVQAPDLDHAVVTGACEVAIRQQRQCTHAVPVPRQRAQALAYMCACM